MTNLTLRATHDATMRRACGVTLETAVRRILTTWGRATAGDREAGARWYGDDAATLVSDLACVGGVDRAAAAAVVAQLSPRTTWSRNVSAATALCLAYGQGGPDRSQRAYDAARAVGAMGANVDRALVALREHADGADPVATVKGPKTNAFARNLMGDRDAVTVDVWAARIALAPSWRRGQDDAVETVLGRAGVYAAVSYAYTVAARRAGVDPTTMQATTWVVVRNGRAA